VLDARSPLPRRFRRLPHGGDRASQPYGLRLLHVANSSIRFASSCSVLRRRCAAATLTSADFCPPLRAPLSVPSLSAGEQTSRGKTHDFRSIHPPHIRPSGPGDIGLQVLWPPRPPDVRLGCGSCSSGQSFAYSFLPTPPRGDAVAVRLGVPVTKVPRGLPPPSHAPCPAQQTRRGGGAPPHPRGSQGSDYCPAVSTRASSAALP